MNCLAIISVFPSPMIVLTICWPYMRNDLDVVVDMELISAILKRDFCCSALDCLELEVFNVISSSI